MCHQQRPLSSRLTRHPTTASPRGTIYPQTPPTASRSRVAAVLASLSLPLIPLNAAATPTLSEAGKAIIETASQGISQTEPPSLTAVNSQSDIQPQTIEPDWEMLKQDNPPVPPIRANEQIGDGYGYQPPAAGYGYQQNYTPPTPPPALVYPAPFPRPSTATQSRR